MLKVRLDVSGVPPQGGYIAKQCPVRIQNEILRPIEPAPPTVEAQRRMREGDEFEAALFAGLPQAGDGGWLHVDPALPRAEAIEVTRRAMAEGVRVILGGFLPVDDAGRRTGRPDLLVWANDGYAPVDVKHHLTLTPEDGATVLVSEVQNPFPGNAVERSGVGLRKHKGDALQLAHYRRMLMACGYAAGSGLAGILGKEGVVVWYDLDLPMWQTPAKSDGKKRRLRTSMEIYDFEFGFRLDIAATAQTSLAGEGVEWLVEPVMCGECGDCPWRGRCLPILEVGSGDTSLIPLVGFREWRALRSVGVKDRAGLAGLDYPTAILATTVDLPAWLDAAADVGGDALLADLRPRSLGQIEALARAGVRSVADLRSGVDPVTASVGSGGFLPEAILRARAVLGHEPIYRRPGATGDDLPRADIEIDIDMESVSAGAYMWGTLVTDRSGSGLVEPAYRSFVTWEPLAQAEEANFMEFWDWMTGIVDAGTRSGRSVLAYCWFAGAENTHFLRMAAQNEGLAPHIKTFTASAIWIDMMRVFDDSWITGESSGLKRVATLVGHTWDVDDPGGEVSMVRYEEATDPNAAMEDREAARTWLLDYNRGDVEATLAVREYLDREGRYLVPIRA